MTVINGRQRSLSGMFDAADLCQRAGDYERAEQALLRALSEARKDVAVGKSPEISEQRLKDELATVRRNKGAQK